MLDALVRNYRFDALLDHVVSVDDAQVFRASPKADALVEAAIGVPPSEAMFVSSNSFDVMGAKRFGLQVAWVRRSRPQAMPADAGPTDMFKALRLRGEILGTEPDHVRGSLTGLSGLR